MAEIISQTKAGYYDSVNGKVHAGEPMKIGQGLPTLRTWIALHYFLDQMRRSNAPIGTFSGSPVVDSNGWADCSVPGTQVEYSMGTSNQGQAFWAPTGPDMVLRWNGTGNCTLELSTGFPTATSTTDWNGGTNNRIIYDGSAGSTAGVSVYAANGYPTDIQLFSSVANEALYDAGNHIHPDFIQDVAESCSPEAPLRFMDVLETNQSGVLDYVSDWDEVGSTWGNTISYPRGPRRIHLRSVAEICNEANRDPWICVPMMLTDASVTAMLTDLNTYLNPGLKVWIENGNEHWNTGTGFKNGFNWTRMAEAPLHTATVDPATAIATDVGHGLVTGDDIISFNKDDSDTDFPYDGGQESYVVRIDDDNFYLCGSIFGNRRRTVTAITNATTGQVTFTGRNVSNGDIITIYNESTGMTEVNDNAYQVQNFNDVALTFDLYTEDGLSPVDTSAYGIFSGSAYFLRHGEQVSAADTGFTSMYFKNPAERPVAKATNEMYSNESVRVWELADAVFGRDRVVHVLGHKFWTNSKFLDADYTQEAQEKMDWLAVAPYIDYKRAKGVGIDNIGWETQTYQELADFMIDPYVPSIKNTIDEHIQALGCHRLVCYEGGLQIFIGTNGSNGVPQNVLGAQLGGFARSQEAGDMMEAYYKGMSEAGMNMHCNYMMTYANCNDVVEDQSNNPLAWGIQTFTTERDQPRWVTTRNFVQAGGVPKE
jgi:hypothetical protein